MRISLGALAALLLVLPAAADEPPKTKPKAEAKSYQIPYKLTVTNHVMVRVKLNGKGPFNLIVDTGAPAIFIATKIAKKAGVEPDRNGWGKFDTLELEGGLKLTDIEAKIDDPFQLEGMNSLGLAGVELHGMIGYNLLARYKITYDFTSDKLGLTELPGFTPDEVPSFGKGQGGMEFIGQAMKLLGPLMGFKGVPVRKPRGFLGLEIEESGGAVVVTSVLAKSPAAEAGIKPGDKLLKFTKEPVDQAKDLTNFAAKKSPGDEVTLTVERNGQEKQFTIKLGKGL